MPEPLEIMVERDQVQRLVPWEGDSLTVGRGRDCGLRLEDPLASRHHCRLERQDGELVVEDLGSANGTWVDGVRVRRRRLRGVETIRVGTTLLRLQGGPAHELSAVESTQTQEVSREQGMLRTLLGVSRALEQDLRLEALGALLIDAAVSLTRAERGFVFLMEKGRTVLALGRNFAREPVEAPERKVSRTLLGRALESEEPLLLQDAASDGEFAGVASISDLGLRSLLAVPLRYRGEVLGLLLVDHRLASGAFRQDERELLAGLAAMASVTIGAGRERTRLREAERRLASLQRQLGERLGKEREAARHPGDAAAERFPGILGRSPAMEALFEEMERILDSHVPVLLTGESGTGKELVARALHYGGPRAGGPFVTENCGALPDTLLESELFGHVKGAFTGATRDRIGRFEEADGGTLFLDEVGEMSEAMQARLLRALQEGEIRRLGSDRVVRVDVRVIAATNRDLAEAVREGRFREDLYYRLNVLPLRLPPLRERQGDIPLLCEHWLAREALDLGRPRRELTPEALEILEAASWPGNVRQLRNEMRRLTLLGEGPVRPEELSPEVAGDRAVRGGDPGPGLPLPERVAALEAEAIRRALEESGGNRSAAALALGISRFALLRKVEKYGIALPGTGPAGSGRA